MKTQRIEPALDRQEVPAPFLAALTDSRLLSPDQLADVRRWLPGVDMPTLSALLVDMGLLTPYQLRRVVVGQHAGLVLGQYRILDELGQGGFGKVYKALHPLMKRVAAVKVGTRNAVPERMRELFIHEVVATTRLTQPNIALAYEANETDGCLWFAMEYVEGPNLERFVARHKPLPVPLVCSLAYQVAQACTGTC